MVGATSCVISIPTRGLTVVALCDTRNFYVDVPNLMAVMLADSLWSGRSKEEVLIHLKNLHSLSNRCFVRRIWAHQVSLFVSRSRDIALPCSGPAQDLLRIAQACSA